MKTKITPSCRRHSSHRRARASRRLHGFGLSLTILMLLGLSTVILATIILTDTSNRVANRGSLKVQATTLAEAGLSSFYDNIRATMINNNGAAYPPAPGVTTLTSTMNGVTRTTGTYTAAYVGTPTYTTSTVGVNSTITWYFTIQGIGTAATSGTVSKVQTSFTATVVQTAGTGGLTGSIGIGLGAIQSATTINFKTDGGVRVYDVSGLNGANVIANGGIGWVPYSQARATSNPNILFAEGNFQTLAAPSSAWNYTTSPTTGLLKSLGSTIFNSLTNGVVGMTAPASFPSASQTAAWQANWITQAKSMGNAYNGSVSASSIVPNPTNPGQGEHRITAPAYINGDLNVDSGQLYLQPNSNLTKPNVIYVTGNVTNAALLYNRGVDLIVQGQYLETSQSAQYQLQSQYSIFPNMPALYSSSALISLQSSATAINMYTTSSTAEGLIYAANGGIVVNGTNELNGALIAGGTGAVGGVNILPLNGNSFVVKYQSASVVGRVDLNLSVSTAGTVTQQFTPTRMSAWIQVQ